MFYIPFNSQGHVETGSHHNVHKANSILHRVKVTFFFSASSSEAHASRDHFLSPDFH